MTYLDNAATSWPKPPVVAEAMSRFLAQDAANPGRAGHRMAVAAERMLDSVRKELTEFVGGQDLHRMIWTMNCTDALNIAFKSLLRSGDHVITSTLEHNSVSRPLQAMADSGFITLTRVDFSPSTGLISPD
ncbi:MAG: aminotransferase class V-fold PLP-dependent enzyme, partial [Phycisphaerales bacterium]|nr:aminotransferase class V-fold PLP-dependent enzyme [Phycisphaerales bacterium]